MKVEEINGLIKKGEVLTLHFGIRQHTFSLGSSRITEKQFNEARKRFDNKLEFSASYGGLTKHFYKIKS